MVWSPGAVSVEFRDVPRRHSFPCYSLYFNTLLVGYVEVKYQLKQSISFAGKINLTNCECLTKKIVLLINVSMISLEILSTFCL